MPTATNDTYTAAAGATIYAGRTAPNAQPTWRSAMTAMTWASLPGNTMSSVDPKNNAAMNPAGAGNTAPWSGSSGQTSIINSWGCTVYDQTLDILYPIFGGGHSDYGGNEGYKHLIKQNVPACTLMRAPSGAIGNTITLADGLDTAPYSDGRPRSGHPYGHNLFVPGVGPIIAKVTGTFTGASGYRITYKVDTTTGEASILCNWNALAGVIGNTAGASVYDPDNNCLYVIDSGTVKIARIDLGNNTASAVGSTTGYTDTYMVLRHLPGKGKIVVIGSASGVITLKLLDTTTFALSSAITLTGSLPAGMVLNGFIGMVWVPNRGQYLLWSAQTNLALIGTLTPPAGDPTASPWTLGTLTPSGGVTPSAQASGGTNGSLAYSPNLDALILLNRTTETPYAFALS